MPNLAFSCLVRLCPLAMLVLLFKTGFGQTQLSGFTVSPAGDEQTCSLQFPTDVAITINAPAGFYPAYPTILTLYALPNGNSTAWTIGKRAAAGEDWHFAIQHIGAQTRFLRHHVPQRNFVTIYLETAQKSWPAWSKQHAKDKYSLIYAIVDTLRHIFSAYPHEIVFNGHSGGGSFIFNFIDGQESIPPYVKRIAFLDSDYNYSDERQHGDKLARWLQAAPDHYLCVLAYNDSIALYDGKPIVTPTGGTWYRSQLMQKSLARYCAFTCTADTAFIKYFALDGRIQFWLKQNPTRAILHTVQVERNGFIHSLLAGTPYDQRTYRYYGERAYEQFIR